MTTNTIDPNMGFTNPTPGQEPGPQYATDITGALTTIGAHTHTGAANSDGKQIPSAGLNINADLSFQSNNLTTLRSTRFANQSAVLSGSGDVGCIYEVGGDLYYNNSSGVPIKITAGSAINIVNQLNWATIAFSGNHTINSTDVVTLLEVDTTSVASIVTLPAANAVPTGRVYIIKDIKGNSETHNITINPAGTDKIENTTNYVMKDNYTAVTLVSDGTSNWSLYLYDRRIYFSGETLKLTGGAALTSDASSTVVLSGTLVTNNTVTANGAVTTNSSLTTAGDINIHGTWTSTVSLGFANLNNGGTSWAPLISQADNTANSATGQNLTIQAQNATGTTSIGGGLVLHSGSGTSTNGTISLVAGSGNTILQLLDLNVNINVGNVNFSPSVGPDINQRVQTSDIVCHNMTIAPQAPFTTATGTNRIPGSLNLVLSGPSNGGTTHASVNLYDTGVNFLSFTSNADGDCFVTSSGTNNSIAFDTTFLGFYGTGSIAKPNITGSLSTVAAADVKAVLTSIINALANLGLASDGTT